MQHLILTTEIHRQRIPLLTLCFCLLLSVGCTRPDREASSDGESADLSGMNRTPMNGGEAQATALMEVDRAMAEAESTSGSPLDAFMTHTTDDVIALAPDVPMARGKEATRAVFAEMYAMPGFSLTWTPSMADMSGDLGYTIGSYHMEFQDSEGQPLAVDGKYMTVWEQQADGTWKVAVDMFNANGPPEPVEEDGS